MVTIIRKAGKSSNGYIDIEYKKTEVLAYLQALTSRPK